MVACFIRFGFHFIPFRFCLLQVLIKRRVFRNNSLDLKDRWRIEWFEGLFLPGRPRGFYKGLKGVYSVFLVLLWRVAIFQRSQAFLKSYFSGWIWLHCIVLKDTSKMDDAPNSKCVCLHFTYCGIALPSFVRTLKNKCVVRWRCICLPPLCAFMCKHLSSRLLAFLIQ